MTIPLLSLVKPNVSGNCQDYKPGQIVGAEPDYQRNHGTKAVSSLMRIYETANIYIRIHKKWNDPCLVQAREDGVRLNSIESVLKILRTQSVIDAQESSNSDIPEITLKMKKDDLRHLIREQFASALKNLCLEELKGFDDEFDEYWKKLYVTIYDGACNRLEGDLNEYLLEIGRLDRNV